MANNSTKPSGAFLRIEVNNLADWVQAILKLQKSECSRLVALGEVFGDTKWLYRGQSNASWPISSSFERMNKVSCNHLGDPERYLRAIERFSIEEFKHQAHSLVGNDSLSNLEWTMLMRHHGVPTRLVDFTEGPLLALFFALEDDSSEDFAVWAVARNEMSDWYLQSIKGKEMLEGAKQIRNVSSKQLREMLTKNKCDDPKLRPVFDWIRRFKNTTDNAYKRITENRSFAEQIFSSDIDKTIPDIGELPALYLYADKPNIRQRVQRGLFLMATHAASPFMTALRSSLTIDQNIADSLSLSDFLSNCQTDKKLLINAKLIQFVFTSSLREECHDYLHFAGLSPSSVYPDLSGVSSETAELVSRLLAPTHDFTEAIQKHLYARGTDKTLSQKKSLSNEPTTDELSNTAKLSVKSKDSHC